MGKIGRAQHKNKMQNEFAEAIFEEYCTAKAKEVVQKSKIVADLCKTLDCIERVCLKVKYLVKEKKSSWVEYHVGTLLEICYLEPYVTRFYEYDAECEEAFWFTENRTKLAEQFKKYYEKRLVELDPDMAQKVKEVRDERKRKKQKRKRFERFDRAVATAKREETARAAQKRRKMSF